MPSAKDEIDDQHGCEQNGIEQVTGNEEATQLGEEPEDANVDLLNQEVFTSGALVNQAKIEKLVQVMSSNAWTREP